MWRVVFSVRPLLMAGKYAWQGLAWGWRNERAIRQEILVVFIGLPVSFWVTESWPQRALLSGSLLVLLAVELLNTAIEVVVDKFGHERDELSGIAKDLGSAAVLVTPIPAV